MMWRKWMEQNDGMISGVGRVRLPPPRPEQLRLTTLASMVLDVPLVAVLPVAALVVLDVAVGGFYFSLTSHESEMWQEPTPFCFHIRENPRVKLDPLYQL